MLIVKLGKGKVVAVGAMRGRVYHVFETSYEMWNPVHSFPEGYPFTGRTP